MKLLSNFVAVLVLGFIMWWGVAWTVNYYNGLWANAAAGVIVQEVRRSCNAPGL